MKRNNKGMYEPFRMYTPPHEVLPYELELKLPLEVSDKIYSFVRPKYIQENAKRLKIERMNMKLNSQYTRCAELKYIKAERDILKRKREQDRKELVYNLARIEDMLQTYLMKQSK